MPRWFIVFLSDMNNNRSKGSGNTGHNNTNLKYTPVNWPLMIRNYINIAWRNIKKHRIFSVINIAGLTIGLSAFWLIALYISDELSYDRYNENADRIFRVVHDATWDGGSFNLAITGVPFGPALKAEYPDVKEFARFDAEGGGTLAVGDKKIKADNILFADNAVFNMFSYHFLQGDPKTALTAPQSIVLTKTLAEKLFGSADAALNKDVAFDKNFTNKVTGVIDDIPENSHYTFAALRSFPANYNDGWSNFYVYTYIMLNKGADYKKLEAQLPSFYNRHFKKDMGNDNYHMHLQPLTSIHLHSNLQYEMSSNGSIKYVYMFSVIALLVLVIAVINYVNLSTASSSVRVKEIGVRKVVGSGKRQLISMFLIESVLLTLLASAIAVAISDVVLPYFNQLTGKSLSLWRFGVVNTIVILVAFSLLTGVLSGLYPAFFLSNFRTIPALKGQMGKQGGNILFRKTLVTFQFVITIVLIAGSGIIYQQIQFALNKNLGFNKDQVLAFHMSNRAVRSELPALKQQLMQSPLIQSVGGASNPIGNNDIGSNGFNFEEESGTPGVPGQISANATMVQNFNINEDFIPVMQIKLLAGRNFSPSMPTDTASAVIVNESLVKQLGWKDAVGKKMQYHTFGSKDPKEATVVGVVKDFNIYSLQHKIEPLVLSMPPAAKDIDNLYVRVNSKNVPAALKYLKDTYKKFDADASVDYTFLDESFARQYQSEQKQGNIIFIFTMLAISIACLGLLGLVTFAAGQRTKEIGIRKVLGATVTSIVFLLSKDFVKLICLAVVIAIPVAWYAMSAWLQNFAYRITISWGVFAIAGLAAIVIALITVSYQAIKSANANPVKAIKAE